MLPSPFARRFGMVSAPFDNEQYRNQGNKATEKPNCYQKVIICTSEPRRLIFVYGDAIFALTGDVLLWLQRCDFRTVKKSFHCLQRRKICTFPPKIVAIGNHFFEWLKTLNSSTACGTVTLKSPLSRAFFTPHVHPRLRKRLSRCTLDCGFKTSESPALRGFVGGLRALATAALYLVLKSNGLHRPKIRLKKFGFSPKIVPANISKKLPAQVLSQIVFHPVFQPLAQTAHVCLHSESGYTLGFRRRIAHSGLHAETGGVSDGGGITTLGAFRTFTNISGPGIRTASFAAFGP